MILSSKRITKALIRLCIWADWSPLFLLQAPEDRFSRVKAHNLVDLFVFVALHPKSTAMVIAGRSVHLTTLFFLGRLDQAVNQ